MRNQNDSVVKAKPIRNEEHLLSLLNYTEKENVSQKITTMREEDLLTFINRHRKIEHKKLEKGGRKALVAKQFIISFPGEFSQDIDNLDLEGKKKIARKFINNLAKYIKEKEPDLDVQDLVNTMNIDLHNDTDFRHFHLIQMNTIKLKNGQVKRIDLGKKGYLVNLKTTLFSIMKEMKPNQCEELTKEELNKLRTNAAQKNQKYATSYKILLNAMNPQTIQENIKYVKKLDKKLTQFNNFVNKPNLDDKDKLQGLNQFYKDLQDLIAKSVNYDIKVKYEEELNKIKKSNGIKPRA